MEDNQQIHVIQKEVSPFGLLNFYYSEKSALMPGIYLATCLLEDAAYFLVPPEGGRNGVYK